MRKLVCLALLTLAGCQNTAGPFQTRPSIGRVDDPYYSIPEQQSRGRDRLALPDDFSGLAPQSGAAIPGQGYPSTRY
jgi:hypothetical protein